MELFWFNSTKNVGDSINPFLFQKLLNLKIEYNKNRNIEHLLGVGSIMQFATKESIVCGSGVITPTLPITKPKKIISIRGPKSQQILKSLGIECPSVFGDPVLLLPRVYNPNIEKKYDLGIVPHYVDFQDNWVKQQNCFVIDVTLEPLVVIDQILSCKFIISSSLHGLIIADAYGIPNSRIKISNKLFGGDFKFLDYEGSINKKIQTYNIKYTANQIKDDYQNKKFDIDLDLLYNSLTHNDNYNEKN